MWPDPLPNAGDTVRQCVCVEYGEQSSSAAAPTGALDLSLIGGLSFFFLFAFSRLSSARISAIFLPLDRSFRSVALWNQSMEWSVLHLSFGA
jgi:hypothetical protein